MSNDIKGFAAAAVPLSKTPLGIIALFIVLIYGFACLLTGLSSGLSFYERIPLIYFAVIFPVIVLALFGFLVVKYPDNLYGPSDYKDEQNYIQMRQLAKAAASLAVASSQREGAGSNLEINIEQAVSSVETIRNARRMKNRCVLWVDDRPENNKHIIDAFNAIDIEVVLALNTQQALELLSSNSYSAIISDMGRKEGPAEGYVLLEAVRKTGDKTPFFIFAGSNLKEHRDEALRRGAQGSTNNANELFKSVTRVAREA